MNKKQLQRGLHRLVIVVSIIVALVAAAYAGTITRTPAEAQNVAIIYTALAGLTFGGVGLRHRPAAALGGQRLRAGLERTPGR
jgi:hypothetical protein